MNLYSAGGGEPRFYTVDADKAVADVVPLKDGAWSVTCTAPTASCGVPGRGREAGARGDATFDPKGGRLLITLRNNTGEPLILQVAPNAYLKAKPRRHELAPGAQSIDAWDLGASRNWYDFVVTCPAQPAFERRFAGHGEDGRPSVSDPLLGRQA